MSMKSSSALQEIRSWNLNCVKQALTNNGLGDCCATFERHNIDGEDLLNLTEGKLALWKRDLTLPSRRSILKFVAELSTSPEKFLLQKSARPNFLVKPAFRPVVPVKKPALHPGPNRTVGSTPTQPIQRPVSRSPVSDAEAWDTDFDDDVDEQDAPAPAPNQLPLVPVPSRLFGTAESSRPMKPPTPRRPHASAMRTMSDRGNAVPSPAHPAPARPPGVSDLSQPSFPDLNSLISKINLSESFCDEPEYAEYTEMDLEDDLKRGEKFSSSFQPYLPPREPHQMQLPVNIPERPPYNKDSLRNLNRSPTPNIPHVPRRKVANEISNEPPQLPSRENIFPRNLTLNKRSLPNNVYPNDDSHIGSSFDLVNGDAGSNMGDGYSSDEYEAIEDPNNDYMPPIQVTNSGPGQPWLAVPTAVSLPAMKPPSPKGMPRRVSDASSTSSCSSSSKLSEQLRSAMINFSTHQRAPSPPPSEHREKTPTPDVQSKPPPPPLNQKPPAFPGVQRPLPPTPPPPRLGQTYTQMPWFHQVDRKRGEELLRNGEDGYFLLRPSARTENPLTLTLWYGERMYHISLRHRADQRYSLGTEKTNEQSFISVEELVQYYQKEALVLYSNGERTGKSILTVTPPRHHV